MKIYVVQQGDTLRTVSEKFKVSIERLMYENGIREFDGLATGQALVITEPGVSHIVQKGDTIESISKQYHITPMQLFRNNPFLYNRANIYPGESLTISYNTEGSITTNGYAYTYIQRETLIKTLPNLTYLSVFNYTTTLSGEIIELKDDTEIINIAKEFKVIPLLMLTAVTPLGLPNIELAYKYLLDSDFQEATNRKAIDIIKSKGYMGVNIVVNYLNEKNQMLYFNFVEQLSKVLRREGFLFFITFNYRVHQENGQIKFQNIDYLRFSSYADNLIFLKFYWGLDFGPPAPVSNINIIRALIEKITEQVAPDKLVVGKPTIGLDWQLPYEPYRSSIIPLSLESVIYTAKQFEAVIRFDEDTQTPYYYYNQFNLGYPFRHIVWFIDARSLNALDLLILEYQLNGSGIWNIMLYNPQVWTIINSRFEIIKLI